MSALLKGFFHGYTIPYHHQVAKVVTLNLDYFANLIRLMYYFVDIIAVSHMVKYNTYYWILREGTRSSKPQMHVKHIAISGKHG